MRLTNKTKYSEIAPFLNPERVEAILAVVEEYPLKKSLFQCTCGEFCRVMDGNAEFIEQEIMGVADNDLAVVRFGKLKRFQTEMGKITNFLNLNKRKESAIEKQARNGVFFPTAQQNILLVVQNAFYLNSLTEAEKVPFSNYLILQQSQSAESLYLENINKLKEQEYANSRRS